MFPNGKPSFTANSDRLDRPGGGSRGRYRRSNRRWLFGRDAHKEDPFHPGQQDLDTGASCPCTACDHLDVCPAEPAERESELRHRVRHAATRRSRCWLQPPWERRWCWRSALSESCSFASLCAARPTGRALMGHDARSGWTDHTRYPGHRPAPTAPLWSLPVRLPRRPDVVLPNRLGAVPGVHGDPPTPPARRDVPS